MAAQSIDRSLEISEAVCAACGLGFPARPGVTICGLCRANGVPVPSPAVPPVVVSGAAPAVLAAVAAVIAAPPAPEWAQYSGTGCGARRADGVRCPSPIGPGHLDAAGLGVCSWANPEAPVAAPRPVSGPYEPGWRAMSARKFGRCDGCGFPIQVADSIGWNGGTYKARHDRCVPRVAAPAPRACLDCGAPVPAGQRYVYCAAHSAAGENARLAALAPPAGAVNILDMIAPPAPTPRPVGPRDPSTLWERVPARDTTPTSLVIPGSVLARAPGTLSAAPTPIAPAAVTTALAGMANRHGWVVTPDESGALGLDVRMDPLDGKVVTVAQIADAWAAADLPASWLLGAASPVASLGRAVAQLRRGGAIVTSEGSHEGVWNVEARIVGARVGEASRVKTLTVSLGAGGALRFEPSDHPGRAAVEEAYAEARAGRLDTSQLRRWVDALIFDRLAGTTSGHAHRFIPIAGSPVWTRIEAAVNTAMGSPEGGIFVAIPMASIKSLTVRVRAGILANAEEAIKKAEADLASAEADDSALGTASARSSLDKIAAAGAQLDSYALVIGDQPECKARLEQLRGLLARHARDARGRAYRPDAVERMAGVWDELRREAAKSDAPAPAGE